jgi:hypothetical protein
MLLTFAATCWLYIWGAFALCNTYVGTVLAPPFVSWAIEAGWEVRSHLGTICWVLTDDYTDGWAFCLDGTGQEVTPYPPGLP